MTPGCKTGILTNEGIKYLRNWLIPGQIYPPRTYVCQGTRFINGMSLEAATHVVYLERSVHLNVFQKDVDLAGVGP